MPDKRLDDLLWDFVDSSYVRCRETEEYKEIDQRYKANEKEIIKVLPKSAHSLWDGRFLIQGEIDAIRRVYTNEAIFFYGMEMGLLLAEYRGMRE